MAHRSIAATEKSVCTDTITAVYVWRRINNLADDVCAYSNSAYEYAEGKTRSVRKILEYIDTYPDVV